MINNSVHFKSSVIVALVFLLTMLLLNACKDQDPPVTGDQYLELTMLGNQVHQQIHGFGASDAWSCQFIGENWPELKKNQIADWLFSNDLDENGHPLGIGLNTWRFNIGAGSAFQGGASGIGDEWRRAESFMTGENSFDSNQHPGQRWFLNAAKERGVSQFIGFVNSPPIYLTKNGKAWSSSASSFNLKDDKYQEYADFLADVVEALENNDQIELDVISPVNEPQWDWNSGGQEGTPAQNSQIANISKVLNATFQDRNIDAMIEIPEAAQIEFLYKDHNKAGRGDQIDAFFDPNSENYLGDLSHIAKKVAGHSYYSTWPLSNFIDVRKEVAVKIDNMQDPVENWMTEYCILENNEEIKGNGRDLGMNSGLYASRVIFADLVLANASSWQWWLGVSPYNYKDGLVYTDYNKFDGNIYDSKLLWSLGNFSRFIKSGMYRVGVGRSDFRQIEQTLEGVMATSFVSSDSSDISIVLINYSQNSVPVKIKFEDLPVFESLDLYLTNAGPLNNLAFQGKFDIDEVYDMPPRSVVTLTTVH